MLAPHPGRYEVFALTAHSRVDELAAQCRQWRPRFAVLWDARQTTPPLYQVQAMPSSYLIDPQGRIAWTHRGFAPSDATRP